MDHFINIYRNLAYNYHQLIIPEDTDGNLLPAMKKITSFEGKRVLDLGTGTGRIPLLVGKQASQVICLDLHSGMLKEHQRQKNFRADQWEVLQGDMRTLPISTGWANVVTAGWAIGHFTGWYPQEWQMQAKRVLKEMHRVAAPGGALIIMETLTTGSLTAAPPTETLAQFYSWLENRWGFNRQEISTDYQFAGVADAVDRTEFFFGEEMAEKVKANNWARLPEWTGVWGKQV